ncbi:RNA transmembrane transporter [Mactra antiquata]
MSHGCLISSMFWMLIFLHGYVESTSYSPGLVYYNGIRNVQITTADFNKTYPGIVNYNSSAVFEFRYNLSSTKENPVRIYSTSNESQVDFPTMFVIHQERSVMSWQIPLVLQYSNEYFDVGRTLCPMQNESHTLHTYQKLQVEVSTQSVENVSFTLMASRLDDFLLEVDKDYPVISSPSNPVYYKYKFTGDIESVIITAKSNDKKCSILSIQDIKCPVFDLPADVVYQGKYQTMTTKGAITVTKSDFSDGAFYVVIVVKSNDNDCSNGINEVQPLGFYNIRQKHITIHIKQTIPSSEYYRAIIAAVGLFLAFYLVALLIGIFYHGCKDNWGIIDVPTFEASMSEEDSNRRIINDSDRSQDYGSIPGIADGAQDGHVTPDNTSVDSLNSEEYDFIKDADHDKDVFRTKKYGIPQHFGLFYAMGFALCMEGIMSGCYHVCPTVSNFQFDTSFMYIMACLCILKIYQNRHPDISAKPHSAYMTMAFVIFIAVIGVIDIFLKGCCFLWYLTGNRFILLLLGNIVNWSIAIFGVIGDKKFDFASFLLAIFIGNLLLYSTFYILSKKLAGEKIPILTWVIILLAIITWAFALYFFLQHLTSWQYTPAVSRQGNKECVVLNFYDTHDIWHFLSAISLFFSFLVLLTLDDEIIMMRRTEIPVF